MMLEDVRTRLESVLGEEKVAYRLFPEGEAPELPYAVWYVDDNNNFGADGVVFYSAKGVTIELLVKYKNPSLEDAIESAFSDVYWDKSENYIESEKCTQILYTLEV